MRTLQSNLSAVKRYSPPNPILTEPVQPEGIAPLRILLRTDGVHVVYDPHGEPWHDRAIFRGSLGQCTRWVLDRCAVAPGDAAPIGDELQKKINRKFAEALALDARPRKAPFA